MLSIASISSFSDSGPTNAIPFQMAAAPTAGNLLVAYAAASQYLGPRVVTAPDASWTKIDDQTVAACSLSAWWKIAGSGESGLYTFSISGTNEHCSGELYEISGANATAPIHRESFVAVNDAGTTLPGLTPSALGTLPLLGITGDQNNTVSAAPSGFTVDVQTGPNFHNSFSLHGPLTADTSTAIAPTFTLTNASGGGVAILLLIAPSASVSSRLMLLGCGG